MVYLRLRYHFKITKKPLLNYDGKKYFTRLLQFNILHLTDRADVEWEYMHYPGKIYAETG